MKQPKLTNDGAIIYCDCGNIHDLTIEYDDDGNAVKVNDEITFVKPKKEEDGTPQENKTSGSGDKSRKKPHGFFGRRKPAGKSK